MILAKHFFMASGLLFFLIGSAHAQDGYGRAPDETWQDILTKEQQKSQHEYERRDDELSKLQQYNAQMINSVPDPYMMEDMDHAKQMWDEKQLYEATHHP
jgi:hypothetical protein